MEKVISKIKLPLKGRVAIIGIGNRLRGDDGFGPVMIERLKGKIGALTIDVGTTPENYLGPILEYKPDTVILLDTADMGMEPGSIDILNKDDILRVGFSTHDASPAVVMEFLEAGCKADILMIVVQPRGTVLGGVLCEEVKSAAAALEKAFLSREKAVYKK